jgi:hypothetical protein
MWLIIQLVLLCAIGSWAESGRLSIQNILKESGIVGGLVVHVGDGDGEVLAALHASEKKGACVGIHDIYS